MVGTPFFFLQNLTYTTAGAGLGSVSPGQSNSAANSERGRANGGGDGVLDGRTEAVVVGVRGRLAVAFVVLPTDEWIGRYASIAQTEDISGDTRAQIWRDTVPMIREHLITGVGMGGYETAFLRFKNVAPTNTVDYAHNDYLQYLAELGLVGFALALAVLGRCLYWMARGLERSRLVAGACGAVAAMGAHSLVDFNLYIPASALVLAWILGMATAPALTEGQRATSE